MSLEFAILGFLNYQPYSGYGLKKIFDTSIRHFWPADQSQIYRTLAKLTKKGWAEIEVVEQEDRPDRKDYHITDTGRHEMLNWLISPPAMDEPRSAPLVQVFFLGQLSDEAVLEKFEGFAQIMQAVLDGYDQVPEQIMEHAQMIQSPREHHFWMLTLDLGIRTMRANLEWALSVIEQIKNGEIPTE